MSTPQDATKGQDQLARSPTVLTVLSLQKNHLEVPLDLCTDQQVWSMIDSDQRNYRF